MPDLAPMQDRGWLGVEMRLEPHLVPAGYASRAVNMRFTNGVPETRKGLQFHPWLNKISGTNILPWTTLHGLGLFSDPDTRFNYLIVAADNKIYRTLANNAPVEMTLPAGESISGTVTFTQAASRIICHRGFDTAGLWCEGITVPWEAMPEPAAGTGTTAMPNLERSIYFQNRLWGFKDDDTVVFSELNDPSSYQPVTQEFYVNQGGNDRGVALFKWGKSALVIFKQRSIFVLYNVYGDLSAVFGDTLTLEFGCAAAETICDVGNELWFLAHDGSVRALVDVGTTEEGRLKLKTVATPRGEDVPWRASDPVQPLFEEIKGRSLSGAVGSYCNNKFYLAIPGPSDLPGGWNLISHDDAAAYDDVSARWEWPHYVDTTPPAYYWRWTLETVTGRDYRIIFDAYTTKLVNGTEEITAVLGKTVPFTAQGTSVYLLQTGADRQPRGSIQEDRTTNNHRLLVYDFIAGAWAGYDDFSQFGIDRLLSFPMGSGQVLLVMTSTGYCGIHEQDYQDKVPIPYLDVEVATLPAAGNTVAVSGGSTVVAAASDHNLDDPINGWGCNTLENARINLFQDGEETSLGGYSPSCASMWTHPNCYAMRLLDEDGEPLGVRFVSTNGIMPTVAITGTWAKVTYHSHLPIVAELTTRGYSQPGTLLLQGARLALDLQTWMGDVDVSFIPQGVNTEVAVGSHTPSRTAYYRPAGLAAFVETNANDDFGTAHREDYSVLFGDDGTTQLYLDSEDVRLGLHQQAHWAQQLPDPNDWVHGQVKLVNNTGRMRVLGCAVTSAPAGERDGATN